MSEVVLQPGPTVASTPHRFTREEYFAMAEAGVLGLDDAVELIEGRIVEMSPENLSNRVAIANMSEAFIRAL